MEFGPRNTFRVIGASYPAIDLYDDLEIPPEDWVILHQIEGLTNARVRDEIDEVPMISPGDRATGPGSSYINAPFTRLNPTRFSDGTSGIYYCAERELTSIREVAHHRRVFMEETGASSQTLVFRTIKASLIGVCHDVVSARWPWLKNEDYSQCQQFGAFSRTQVDFLRYESVRHPHHPAFAVFKPRSLSNARHIHFLEMYWDGSKITHHSIVRSPN